MTGLYLFSLVTMSISSLGSNGLNPVRLMDYQAKEEIVVRNPPRGLSQGASNICYTVTATLLLNHKICQEKGISPCSEAKLADQVSQNDVSRFQVPLQENKNTRMEYPGILYEDGGGGVASVLYNTLAIAKSSGFVNSDCARNDIFAAKTGEEAAAVVSEEEEWKKIKAIYEKGAKAVKEKENCYECGLEYAAGIMKDELKNYKIKTNPEDLLLALSGSFEEFKDILLVPFECQVDPNVIRTKNDLHPQAYPKSVKDKVTTEEMMNKIKSILMSQNLTSLSFCAKDDIKNPKITSIVGCHGNMHSLAIKAYKKICKKNDPNSCREVVQVQNSWGEQWQKDNENGWVDAIALISRTFNEAQTVVWIDGGPAPQTKTSTPSPVTASAY